MNLQNLPTRKIRNQTIAHNVRNSPVRLGACFLSVTDRFEPVGSESIASPGISAGLGPGADDTSRGPGGGGGFVGPVERYDLVSARQQPATCEDRRCWCVRTPLLSITCCYGIIRKTFTFFYWAKETVTHIPPPPVFARVQILENVSSTFHGV